MKYNVYFCKCGHIHFIPYEELDAAYENDQEIVLVCTSCGHVVRFGADKMENAWKEEETDPDIVYDMYTFDIREDFVMSPSSTCMPNTSKAFRKILFSGGVGVPMKTGYNANCFDPGSGMFYDMRYPDRMYELTAMNSDELRNFLANWNQDMKTVNMNLLKRCLTDEQIKDLSGYAVRGFEW